MGEEISFFSEGAKEDILRRLIGIALFTHMPDPGLKEALICLKDIFEFNLESSRLHLPEPMEIHNGVGTVVKVSEAPDLVVSE
jgi:hypothetical protein